MSCLFVQNDYGLGLPRFTGAPENRGFDPKGAGAPVRPKNCGAPALLKGVVFLEMMTEQNTFLFVLTCVIYIDADQDGTI